MVCESPLGVSFVTVVKLFLLFLALESNIGGLLPVVESFVASGVPHGPTTSSLNHHSQGHDHNRNSDDSNNNDDNNVNNNSNADNMMLGSFFLDRRSMLVQTVTAATVVTATSSSLPANADSGNTQSIFSSLQSPVQDIVSPGHWLGQFIGINSKSVKWTKFPPSTTKEEASKALVEVINDLSPDQLSKLYMPNYVITASTTSNVHVRTWTKNEWLDSLDVQFIGEGTTCTAKASFYATGFLPTSIPGAPIINTAFAWFPFASPGPGGEMLQDYRLRVLEALLIKKLKGQTKA